AIVGTLAYNNAKDALEEEAFAKLEAVSVLKESRISGYFDERKGDALVLAEMADFNLDAAYTKIGAIGTIKSDQMETYFGERLGDINVLSTMPVVKESIQGESVSGSNSRVFQNYMEAYGYYDLFLIASNGEIFYTVEKESDYGQNLFTGSLSNTNLAKIAKEAMTTGRPVLSDFAFYGPSNDNAAFVAAPSAGGVVALQINTGTVNGIMQERTGMGESGETYLVSADDFQMRSDSRFETFSTILNREVRTEGVTSATGELQVAIYPDYRGVPVLGAFKKLNIQGLNWVILSEIDELEALTPQTEKGDYFKTYTEVYGYYDLFLINPDGHVFYTVAKESDFNTNLISGEYRNSNLGELFRSVSSSGRVELSDIEPYAPSGDAPAGFIAAPVQKNGKLVAVVALQISTGQIDSILQMAEGMGETGESYLLGRDMKFRSNSRLTSEDTLLVLEADTKGPQEAFKTRNRFEGIYGDYTSESEANSQGRDYDKSLGGVPVLGMVDYMPELDWVMVSEIDEKEAFAKVNSLRNILLIVIGIAIAIVIALAFLIAMSIVKPVNKIRDITAKLAQTGDLNIRADVSGKDEIGEMASSLNMMLDNVAGPIKELSDISAVIADGDLTRAVKIENAKGDVSVLIDSFKAMVDNLRDLIKNIKENADFTASASEEMAASAEEVNASMTEVSSTIQQVSSGAQTLSKSAGDSLEKSQKTGESAEAGK
ncbi:MAG: methyl-accepting chemotaxis protein, partial [Candidatus Hydrothermarchaeaceae archaeon]